MSKPWIHRISLLFFTSLVTLFVGCSPRAEEAQMETAAPVDSDALRQSLTSLVEQDMVAGAVGLVAQDGEVVFRGAAGYSDRESNRSMTTDNLFRIASMSKAITSVATMILVEEGHFTLDDPVSEYIPALAKLEVLEQDDDGASRLVAAKGASFGFAEDKFGLGFSIASSARDGIPQGVIGWGGFYGSEFWIDRDTGIVAVFMSQVYDLPRRSEIVRRFGSEVFRTLAPPHSD